MNEIRPVGNSKPKKINCRILFATNAPLEYLVDKGLLRTDLFYRLKKLEINVSPLRERPKDIIPLVNHYLTLDRTDNQVPELSTELQAELISYKWPGNVRELINEIERMRLMSSEGLVFEKSDINLAQNSTEEDDVPTKNSSNPEKTVEQPVDVKTDDQSKFLKLEKTGKSSIRRLQRIRNLFIENRNLTRAEITQIMEVSSKTIGSDLNILLAENFIVKIKPSKSSRSFYFQFNENVS